MKHRGGVREREIEKTACVKSLREQRFCILASDVKSLSIPFCQTPPPSGDNHQDYPHWKWKWSSRIIVMVAQWGQFVQDLNMNQCAPCTLFSASRCGISFILCSPHTLHILVTFVGLTHLSQRDLLRVSAVFLWSQFIWWLSFTSSTFDSFASTFYSILDQVFLVVFQQSISTGHWISILGLGTFRGCRVQGYRVR